MNDCKYNYSYKHINKHPSDSQGSRLDATQMKCTFAGLLSDCKICFFCAGLELSGICQLQNNLTSTDSQSELGYASHQSWIFYFSMQEQAPEAVPKTREPLQTRHLIEHQIPPFACFIPYRLCLQPRFCMFVCDETPQKGNLLPTQWGNEWNTFMPLSL